MNYNFDGCRYASCLIDLLTKLQAVQVLFEKYEDDYQGFVDVDVLLSDGRVFSYAYSYGSCSECDEWENLGLSYEEIINTILQEATFFNSINEYNQWLLITKNRNVIRR